MQRFSADELLETAIERAGTRDFGNPDFREGLEILVDGINNSDNMIEDRKPRVREEFLRLLTNRLLRTKDISENPDILDQTIQSPTVIISLPRTGSTKLQQVLEATDHFQQALCWQLRNPGRVPGMDDGGEAVRLAEAEKFYDWRSQISPDFHKLHSVYPDKADEETGLLAETFKFSALGVLYYSLEYLKWLATQNISPSYDYLLTQLKYLQWQFNRDSPRSWLLKSPEFLGFEDQVTRIFPRELKIIFLHRAPVDIIPSAAKLTEATRNLYYHQPAQSRAACKGVISWTSGAIKQHMRWRDANPQVEVLDLSFKEVSTNSLRTCEKICDFIGTEFTNVMAQRIKQWDMDNPRYKHGKAEYSLDDYGFSERQINEKYAEYLNRFSEYIHVN